MSVGIAELEAELLKLLASIDRESSAARCHG
jgi:hypothetical protein